MADLVYTLNPLKGVDVAKYFIEDLHTGIWKKLFVRSDFMIYFQRESLRKTSFGEVEAVGRMREY